MNLQIGVRKTSEPSTVSTLNHDRSANENQPYSPPNETNVNRLGYLLIRTLVSFAVLLTLLYIGDYMVVRLRATYPRLGHAFDSVQMARLYAIPLKNGKTEFELDAQQPQVTVACVRALFPHLGYSPCWYLRRNSQKPIPMVILIPTRP